MSAQALSAREHALHASHLLELAVDAEAQLAGLTEDQVLQLAASGRAPHLAKIREARVGQAQAHALTALALQATDGNQP